MRFANDFHSWLRHSWKLLANRLTRDPKIVIHGNSCIILYISIVDALELLQFCSQPSIYTSYLWKEHYLIKLRSYWTMSETVWEHRRHLSSLANTLHSMTQHIERKWVSCHLLCGKRLGAGNETCNTFVFLALVEPSKSYCVEVYRNTWGIYGWVRARKT